MEHQVVFQEKKEVERLTLQNRLLLSYEKPVFQKLFAGRTDLKILDVGCNGGEKTVEWFSRHTISKVVGLEYNAGLVERAQSLWGEGKFSFYPCDVDREDFEVRLQQIMEENGIKEFDAINLSLVLLHLKDPAALLRKLRRFLSADGMLFIVESNDGASWVPEEDSARLETFLSILAEDPYAGNRKIGPQLPTLVTQCGYEDAAVWYDYISARPEETEKKRVMFRILCSFLPEDVVLLREKEPENEKYAQWDVWLKENYEPFKQTVLGKDAAFRMGIRFMTCRRGEV